MKNTVVRADDQSDIRTKIRPDDMLVSGCDVAFAGAAFGLDTLNIPLSAAHIASLAHFVTRIVLSERIVLVSSPGAGADQPPTSFLLPLVERYCSTLQIDERYSPVAAVISQVRNAPKEVFGEKLVDDATRSSLRFAPWSDWSFTEAVLAEYGVANLLQLPFAPNPVLSTPLSLHSLRGRTSADQILSYVDDLRRETSQAMNMLEGWDIYDLNVPAIFGAVLREARQPSDVILIASQMNADAKAFRAWCRDLSEVKENDPHKYIQRLEAAKDSLRTLGKSLNTAEAERMQVSAPSPLGSIKLPVPTLKKVISFFDVDMSFFRPRSFLLNLLSSARQVKSLAGELARVFRINNDHARLITEEYLKLAEYDALTYRASAVNAAQH